MVRRCITKRRGSAAIEFVWTALVLVPVLMFAFQIFQATMHGSGGLIKSRLRAFDTLDRASGVGHRSIVYAGHAGGTFEPVEGCVGECDAKLNYTYSGPMRSYPYGLSSFDMQVRRSFVVKLR